MSKSKILSGLQCPKRLFLEIHHPEWAEVPKETERAFSAGRQVGEIARSLHPDGRFIGSPDDLGAALRETAALLACGAQLLFEPAFRHGGVVVRCDLLFNECGKVRLVEVKSSAAVKDYHLADAAIQAWVLRGVGLALECVRIAHVDTGFVYLGNGDYDGLLKEVEVMGDIQPLIEQVPAWVEGFQTLLAGDTPAINVGRQCEEPYPCPFIPQCWAAIAQPDYPVTILLRGQSVAAGLMAEGIEDLRDVPEDRLTNERHRRVWRCTVNGEAELAPELGALPYPRHYLDFETISFAVPLWAGTRPYQQIPFQWSCHREPERGHIDHREFLDVSGEPPMRRFAESLIETLGSTGPIIVYGHFEGMVIRSLIEQFPALGQGLDLILDRLVDLLPLVRRHYYHPDMRDSWSLKSVLPTIAPKLDYSDLDVQHGGMTQETFLEAIDPVTNAERRGELAKALSEYCARDTFALVMLVEFFENAAD